ncbi:MAG: phosphodiester glycosidase family protein [Muribaculaceae bacterium]|nr:phosphodiester glycosidase family protein [Muribaculaceae bacterium]
MMNRKTFLLLILSILACASARADFVIDNTTYTVDTLVHRQVGPGMVNTIVRIPGYPLNVYVLEVDLNNPNNRVETTIGYNTVGRTEALANAYTRNRTATKRPVAGCNGNFWVVTGNGAPWSSYQLGTPLGGVVRNDTSLVNDNTTWDWWDGGPTRTGAAAITHDKTLVLGRIMWDGTISSDKLAQPLAYHNINRRAVAGDICLWGPNYTRTREFEDDWTGFNERGNNHTDTYYLTFAESSGWTNNAPMRFVIANIVQDADRQTLGSYDACLSVTGDANKAAMAALAVGDEIEITSGWTCLDDDKEGLRPDIENMVWGNAPIMHGGELLERNYDETYNSQVYSRTCYGSSADGKHLYLLVIDKATSPLYGLSAGCPTAVACQILKQMCPDVTEMVNMDAGGSAEMMLFGKIINTTTEGTPRAVACGWLVEAVGEEDNEVASIAFDLHRIDLPQYSTATPRILGYNSIGELVDEDVQGVTLSCDPSLGTTSGNTFKAGGDVTGGTLTATLGEMTATVPVRIIAAQPAITLHPILIDGRDYPIEVTATVNANTYFYDPATLDWTVGDGDVVSVTDGVLRGERVGSTTLACEVGEYSDNTEVTVEISPSPYLYQTWDGWTFKGAGAKNITIDEATGIISYTYSTNRAPYLQMSKDLTLYSLPDAVGLIFNSSMPVDYVQIDTRNRYYTTSNFLRIDPEEGDMFEAGKDYTILLNLDALGGADNLGTYPLTIKTIKFTLDKTASAGDYTLALKSFYCHYPNISQEGLVGDLNGDYEINIADVNALIDIILSSAGGTPADDVNGDGEINIADVNALIALILQ